jgi:hypothetical protein
MDFEKIDFYSKYKQEAEKHIRPFFNKVEECKKNLERAQKRLLDQKELSQRDEQQRQKLNGLAEGAVLENQSAFEKFKNTLRKARFKTENNEEAAATIENDIIPRLQRELSAAKDKLQSEFNGFCIHKIVRDGRKMQIELLDEAVKVKDVATETAKKFAEDFGVSFSSDCQVFTLIGYDPHTMFGKAYRALKYTQKLPQDYER